MTNIFISTANYLWELEREYDRAVWVAQMLMFGEKKNYIVIEHIFLKNKED